MDNESTALLIEMAWMHIKSGRDIPDHIRADLQDAIRCDSIAVRLRNQAERVLRECNHEVSW